MSNDYPCPYCEESFDSAKSRGLHKRWNHDLPWEDKENLREKYIGEDMSTRQIANEWDCGKSTISKWVRKHGLEKTRPWESKQNLERLYIDKGMSIVEIADEYDCGKTTIQSWLKKHDISAQEPLHEIERRGVGGYKYVHHRQDGDSYYLRVSRLVAFAHGLLEYGELFEKDIHVHHKNEIAWENNPENLKALTDSEHAKEHTTQ